MVALVVVPTYDELENIHNTVADVLAADVAVDLLVVDDASPDGTGEVADALAEVHPEVHVLHRTGKGGLGTAYRDGFAWGLERGYPVLVEMDADGSHQARFLPAIVQATADADLVLGSRWVPGGRTRGWSLHRYVLSRIGNGYTRFVLGLAPRDVSSGFRAFRASALRALDLSTAEARGYGFQVETVLRAVRAHMRVVEVPITFVERRGGRSKMSLTVAWESARLVTGWGLQRLRSPRGRTGTPQHAPAPVAATGPEERPGRS